MKTTLIKSLFASTLLLLSSCAGNNIFPTIPLSTTSPTLAKPISMVIDQTNEKAYLVNSNYTFLYQDSSLLVLDLSNPIAPTTLHAASIKNYSGQSYLDSANEKLYITNRQSSDLNDADDQLLQVDVDENSSNFLAVTEYTSDANPFGITGDSTNLYVVCQSSLDVFPFATLSSRNEITFPTTVSTGSGFITRDTREAALGPAGTHLFVSNRSDNLLIVNLSEMASGAEAVDYTLASTSSTRGITSDSQYVYVIESNPPSLKILEERNLSTISGTPVETPLASLAVADIPLGANPNEVTVDEANHRAYVTLSDDDAVSVIDTQLFREIDRISLKDNLPAGVDVGEFPFAISSATLSGTPYIYVLNLDSNNVSIIDGTALAVVGSYP